MSISISSQQATRHNNNASTSEITSSAPRSSSAPASQSNADLVGRNRSPDSSEETPRPRSSNIGSMPTGDTSRAPDPQPPPPRAKILTLTGGMGGGHTSPASAVHEHLQEHSHIDSPYEVMSVAPFPRGKIDDLRYRLSDSTRISNHIVEPYRRNFTQKETYSEVKNKITDANPDVVFVNHRILAQAASRVPENTSMVIATADHGKIHAGWYPQRLLKKNSKDILLVPGPDGEKHAVKHGVPKDRVITLGYPVRRPFEEAALKSKEEVRLELNLPLDKKVLVISGGSGHWGGYFSDLLATLAKRQMPNLHIVAIAGASAELKANLEKIEPRIDVRGLCSAELMAKLTRAADFAGIKAGGATIGECYAVETVPIVYQKLSGVEAGNTRHIERQGTGFIALAKDQFIKSIEDLSAHPEKMEKALNNQKNLLTTGSAKRISDFLVDKARLA